LHIISGIKTKHAYAPIDLLLGCLAAVLLLGAEVATRAESVTVGMPVAANCLPFDCARSFGLTTYQQMYFSRDFPGSIDIGAIDFFNTKFPGGPPALGTFTLDLSYTAKALGDLSLANPADNITSGERLFSNGTLPAITHRVLTFAGSPFEYDPRLGNLLLTVIPENVIDKTPVSGLDAVDVQTGTDRAYFLNVHGKKIGAGNEPAGLVTRFDSVPEPSSLLLLFAGLAGVLWFLRLNGGKVTQ
jgi:PEP-CTERM motif